MQDKAQEGGSHGRKHAVPGRNRARRDGIASALGYLRSTLLLTTRETDRLFKRTAEVVRASVFGTLLFIRLLLLQRKHELLNA